VAEKRDSVPAPDQLELALERTLAAYERTMLAWIRTSGSLITFGFALFQFFEYWNEHEPNRTRNYLLSARNFGIVMIVIGVLALVFATLHYRSQLKRLEAHWPQAPSAYALILAALISLLGVLAVVETVFRRI